MKLSSHILVTLPIHSILSTTLTSHQGSLTISYYRLCTLPSTLGGGERVRTDDPLLAKQVLSQLSYTPILKVVGLGRLELPTSRLSGVRSNHLSYEPIQYCGGVLLQPLVEMNGIEPMTPCLQSRCSPS